MCSKIQLLLILFWKSGFTNIGHCNCTKLRCWSVKDLIAFASDSVCHSPLRCVISLIRKLDYCRTAIKSTDFRNNYLSNAMKSHSIGDYWANALTRHILVIQLTIFELFWFSFKMAIHDQWKQGVLNLKKRVVQYVLESRLRYIHSQVRNDTQFFIRLKYHKQRIDITSITAYRI